MATPKNLRTARPFVKPVEPYISFQKRTKYLGDRTISGDKLRFTYANLSDFTSRPYGNLFSSLQLPITPQQRDSYNEIFGSTGLAPLTSATKAIIINIPTDEFGELMDGKTFSLKIPFGAGNLTCYGNYYEFNPDLNTQLSDSNIISSVFGVEPVPDNNFNTNVAYLFTNDLAGYTPRDNYSVTDNLIGYNVTVPANGSLNIPITTPLVAGEVYYFDRRNFPATVDVSFVTAIGEMPFSNAVEANTVFGQSFKLRYNVSALILRNRSFTEAIVPAGIQKITPISTRQWSRWNPTSKYPYTLGGAGIPYARLADPNLGVMVDKPIGIVYLDKGIAVITDPQIVDNMILDNALDQDGDPYTGPADEYTNIYFATAGEASATFNSVVTEYEQGYTCIIYPNEFNFTTNPTFDQAYPTFASKEGKPVYITELGLYNQYEELIALCKTSRPISKDNQSIISFTVKMKV